MTLSIEISGKYRITSDPSQIIIQRKKLVDPTKSPKYQLGMPSEPYEKWEDWKWCGKVTQALDIIALQNVFESDATSLAELRNEITAFNREIRRAMGEDD